MSCRRVKYWRKGIHLNEYRTFRYFLSEKKIRTIPSRISSVIQQAQGETEPYLSRTVEDIQNFFPFMHAEIIFTFGWRLQIIPKTPPPLSLTWAPFWRHHSPSEHLAEPRGAQYAVAYGPVAPPASRSAPQTFPGVWWCWPATFARPPPTARSVGNKVSHDLTAHYT